MSENTIENFKAAVHLIKPGELKAYGEITGAPRAGGAWRDKYGPPRFAAQFGGKFGATRRRPAPASTGCTRRPATSSRCRSTASCRRRTRTARTTTRAPACSPSARRAIRRRRAFASSRSPPAARTGLSRDKRRSYKCALREIEGAYEKGKEPSTKGLPEATDFGKKKRKADEEAPEDIKAVPAEEMAALVFKMKTYAARRALRAQPSRVVTVSTWAPAYFEAVITRDFYSAHCGTALALCPC